MESKKLVRLKKNRPFDSILIKTGEKKKVQNREKYG